MIHRAVNSVIASYMRQVANRDRHTKEVLFGASVAFLLKAFGAGLAFGFNVVLGRFLGPEGAGLYYLALTVITFAAVVGKMGLGNVLLRFTAANVAIRDWATVAAVYRRGIWIAIGASGLATALVIVGASWIAGFLFTEPTLIGPLRLMALGIVPLSLLNLHGELLRGLKRIRDAMFVNHVGIPLVGIALLPILATSLGVTGAALAYVVSTTFVLLLGVALWRRATPELTGARSQFDTRVLITTGLPLLWVALVTLGANNANTVMLGMWVDTESVGIYGVAVRTALLTRLVLVAVNSIIAPKFAALYAQGEHEALGALFRSTARSMTVIAVLALLPLILVPAWVLGLFGAGFIAGAGALRILAIGQLADVAAGAVGPLLIMTGHERVLQRVVTLSGGVSVVLGAILISSHGVLGAAIARTVYLVVLNVLALRAAHKSLKISVV